MSLQGQGQRPGQGSSSFPRKYNLVLYMCCVYIITYLAWNLHSSEPHQLIQEHHHVKKQLHSFVQSKLSESVVQSKIIGGGGGGGNWKHSNAKKHAKKEKRLYTVGTEQSREQIEIDSIGTNDDDDDDDDKYSRPIGGRLEVERGSKTTLEPPSESLVPDAPMNASLSNQKTRGSKHRRHKHHDVHIAMSKESIPQKGNKLVSPWKDMRGKCCRHLGIVNDKLINALPDKDLLKDAHYSTCAIVGSAGLLLTQQFGEEIDEHEAIFRFNIAPAKGFEKHVGSKTTLRLINRHHLGFREFKDEICLFHTTVEDALRKYVRIAQNHPNLPNVPMDMSFYKKVVQWNKLETPTNGYFGLKLALMLCDRIDIYGFLRTWKGYVKYHYFNDEEPNSRQLSRDTKGEMPIILDLLKTHADKIHFKHPCIVDNLCKGCPAGSHCDGRTPYPVPQPGYCQVEGRQCFLKCESSMNCEGEGRSSLCPEGMASDAC